MADMVMPERLIMPNIIVRRMTPENLLEAPNNWLEVARSVADVVKRANKDLQSLCRPVLSCSVLDFGTSRCTPQAVPEGERRRIAHILANIIKDLSENCK
jgi:hypothetical protein